MSKGGSNAQDEGSVTLGPPALKMPQGSRVEISGDMCPPLPPGSITGWKPRAADMCWPAPQNWEWPSLRPHSELGLLWSVLRPFPWGTRTPRPPW